MTSLISPNFTLEQLTRSQTATRLGIRNTPGAVALANLERLAEHILEPLYAKYGADLMISSGYRGPALNAAVPGSSNTSQHTKGQAVDIEVAGLANIDLAEWIVANLNFDQCILEFYSARDPRAGWVHVSYVSPEKNRGAKLTASRNSQGKVIYALGFPKRGR